MTAGRRSTHVRVDTPSPVLLYVFAAWGISLALVIGLTVGFIAGTVSAVIS